MTAVLTLQHSEGYLGLEQGFFGPSSCDEFGNTSYAGFVIEGLYDRENGRIIVLAPEDFKSYWPSISEQYVARYDHGPARKLEHAEVLRLVGGEKRKPTLFDEKMWAEYLAELIMKYSSYAGYSFEGIPSAAGQTFLFHTPSETFEIPDLFSFGKKPDLIKARYAIK